MYLSAVHQRFKVTVGVSDTLGIWSIALNFNLSDCRICITKRLPSRFEWRNKLFKSLKRSLAAGAVQQVQVLRAEALSINFSGGSNTPGLQKLKEFLAGC